jgi:signal peptidase I
MTVLTAVWCPSSAAAEVHSILRGFIVVSRQIYRLKMSESKVYNFFADTLASQKVELKKLWKNKRTLVLQALNLAMIVFSALMIWKGLMFVTKSESPVVVVLSGSMEPAFQRGDILFLNNQDDPIRVGEIVVFKIKDRDIPIVHRVMKVYEDKETGEVEVVTKGDNNGVDDLGLYAPGQRWLKREDILGRARGTLRYLGMVTIVLNDYPKLKYLLISVMGLFVLTNKES